MVKYLAAYVATAVVFFGLDFIWLSTMTRTFYRSRIGSLLLEQPNLTAAGIFYLFYVAGIVYFGVWPALTSGNWTTALISGALLGMLAYGTYDMTNLSTLKGWSVSMTVVDIIWGTFLTGIASLSGYLVTTALVGKLSGP
ncbi:DUF2177 family protein [Rhizobium sp. CG4]|jgi:uncharacterized membrane protein|uniref:DUF2177 family protein n=1 Tax=Rhizobium/Agrobacterium group TaxID=227290 RepID=UPI00203351BC|nr:MULTISPECIES: DUF2177 family protein [unclassified Rhizobium]MCM2458144.1 DUF2177 family protein [Rhizobium sp. CG4]MCS4243054.1 putative membrane protein [Rhizobium sp. BIGb0125]